MSFLSILSKFLGFFIGKNDASGSRAPKAAKAPKTPKVQEDSGAAKSQKTPIMPKVLISGAQKELQNLIDEITADYETYKETAIAHSKQSDELLCEYNSHISQLEQKRATLREKTSELYQTLSRLIGVGEEMTSHDDVAVTPEFHALTPVLSSMLPELGLDEPASELKRKFSKVGDVEKIAAIYHDRKLEYSEDLWEKKGYCTALSAANVISKKYIELIDIVDNAIEANLLPELRAVHGFLHTEDIKRYVKNVKELTAIAPTPISDYRGHDSPYRQHHIFVKNAVDYYITVCRLLIEPYLTRLITDTSAAKDIANEFDLAFKEVGSNLEAVRNSIVLTRTGGLLP